MITIYKYKITATICSIKVPADSTILHVNNQNDEIYVWIDVDTDEKKMETLIFKIYGTGHPREDPEEYIGTVFIKDMVWHIYKPFKDED